MFGQEKYTTKCIELTKKNAGMPVDILVVDDGSPTPYTHDEVKIIRLEKNSGYTNATNQGIIYALKQGYKYVHLLNNDTEPYENFIKPLHTLMESNEQIGIASSVRIHKKPDAEYVELFGIDLIRGYQSVTKLQDLKDEIMECNWVPVCSSLVRLDMIQYLGLLNKRMRNHSSDLEYCLRVKIHGWKIFVVPQSKVLHYHEVTTSKHNLRPDNDQRILLEVLSGLYYAGFMKVMPLDCEQNTFGKLTFEVYQK